MTAQQLADAIGALVIGDGGVQIKWLKSVASADEQSLVFVEDPKFMGEALSSKAAVIVAGEFAAASHTKATLLIASQPKLAFSRAAALFIPP